MDDTNIPPTAVAYAAGLCGPQNPGGHGGWGFTIRDAADTLLREGQGRVAAGPDVTNNVLEYVAVAKAVLAYAETGLGGVLVVRTSSQLVANQMRGVWPVKRGAYVRAWQTTSTLCQNCPFDIRWQWVSQSKNVRAVTLASEVLAEIGVLVASNRR